MKEKIRSIQEEVLFIKCLGLFISWLTLLNCGPYTCQRALCAYVLKCQHALRAYVRTCQSVLRVYVLTCSRLACFACSHANVYCMLCMLTCSHAITTNNKDKCSITCFPDIFVIVLCFFLWNKTLVHFYISLTSQKPLMGVMTNFVQ